MQRASAAAGARVAPMRNAAPPRGGGGGGGGRPRARRGAAAALSRGGAGGNASGVLSRDLGYGDEGRDVKELQRALAQAGVFPKDSATGYYGAVTRDAVRAFQEEQGIPPSGFWGTRTRKAFAASLARQKEAVELPAPGAAPARKAAIAAGGETRGGSTSYVRAPATAKQAQAAEPDRARGAVTAEWSGGRLMPASVFAGACALVGAVFGGMFLKEALDSAGRGRAGRKRGSAYSAAVRGTARGGGVTMRRGSRAAPPPPPPPPRAAGLPSLAATPLRLLRTIGSRSSPQQGRVPGVHRNLHFEAPRAPQVTPLGHMHQGVPGAQDAPPADQGPAGVQQVPMAQDLGNQQHQGYRPARPPPYGRHGGGNDTQLRGGGGGAVGSSRPLYAGSSGGASLAPNGVQLPGLPPRGEAPTLHKTGSGETNALMARAARAPAPALHAVAAAGGPAAAAAVAPAPLKTAPRRPEIAQEVRRARELARKQMLSGEMSVADAIRQPGGGRGTGAVSDDGASGSTATGGRDKNRFLKGFMPASVTRSKPGKDGGVKSGSGGRSTRDQIVAEVEAARSSAREAMRTAERQAPSTPASRAAPPAVPQQQRRPKQQQQQQQQQRRRQQQQQQQRPRVRQAPPLNDSPYAERRKPARLANARSMSNPAQTMQQERYTPKSGGTDGRVLPPRGTPAAQPQAPQQQQQQVQASSSEDQMRIAALEVKLASLELALAAGTTGDGADLDEAKANVIVKLAEEALSSAVQRYEEAAALGARLASAEAALREVPQKVQDTFIELGEGAPEVKAAMEAGAAAVQPELYSKVASLESIRPEVDTMRSRVEGLEGSLRIEMAEMLSRVEAAEAAAASVATNGPAVSAESDMVAADLANAAAAEAMRQLQERLDTLQQQPLSAVPTDELASRLDAEEQRTAELQFKIAQLEAALKASPPAVIAPAAPVIAPPAVTPAPAPVVEEVDLSRWVPRWNPEEGPLNRLKLGREVVLQGFHWESHTHPWYGIVESKAEDIAKAGFTGVWMPPASHSIAPQGYLPSDLYCLDSKYGSEGELRACLDTMHSHGINAYADIVINHRSAPKKGRHDAWNDYEGQRMGWGEWAICSTNQTFAGTGNDQTGDDFPAAPNIDHTNETVRNDLKGWLNWLRQDVGYDGWRFDFAKGYAGRFVGEYVEASNPTFSIGEYWDTMSYGDGGLEYDQSGHRQRTINWIDEAGGNSAAFDFTTKGILQEACRDGSYWRLVDHRNKPAGVLGHWPARAVTFLDNHDTGSTQSHWPFPGKEAQQGYAYILTHPGMPCVAWDHFFDWGDDLRTAISELIAVRQRNCIDSRCDVVVDIAEQGTYAARIGGRVAVRLGGGDWHPGLTNSGEWKKAVEGRHFFVWEMQK